MNIPKRTLGVALIYLLIVVAIIGIIAAIAIPNLLASRRAANEGSAQAGLRTLTGAEATYQATAGAGTFGTLARSEERRVGKEGIACCARAANAKSGYVYLMT